MSETLKLVCGGIGGGLSNIFSISPIIPIIKLCKGQIKLNALPIYLFVCSVINCSCWFSYGRFLEEPIIFASNGIGGSINAIWTVIYLIYFAELKWLPGLIYSLLFVNIIVEFYYIIHFIGGKESNAIIGWLAMSINIIMYASPGANLYHLFKTGNLNLVPIYTCVCGVICSAFWAIYGFTINDFTIIVPNCLGMAFAVIQMICWFVVRRREIKKKLAEGEKPKDTEVQLPVRNTPTTEDAPFENQVQVYQEAKPEVPSSA